MAQVTYMLDACALIAYFRGEEGGERLVSLVEDEAHGLAIHAVNFGEVYYDFLRAGGEEKARELWVRALLLPMEIRRDLDDEFVQRVGAWKVRYSISYADAFALALAEREGVPLITTDHHEFDIIEADGTVDFFWLR